MTEQMTLIPKHPPLKITKPVRLIELFAGIGSQAKALKNLGVPFETYRAVEIDKYALASYNAIRGTEFTTQDITQVHASDLCITDTDTYEYIMTYSFPCFPKGSLVMTSDGYVDVSDVQKGSLVLTHNNTYERVLNTRCNGIKKILSLKTMCADEIKATPEHRFYVRRMHRVGHFSKRVFSPPEWKQLKDLDSKDYVGVAINQNAIIPKWDGIVHHWSDGRKDRVVNEISPMLNIKDFLWIIGRYLGDGWQKKGGIIICCAKKETEELVERIERCFPCTVAYEDTVDKVHISKSELQAFVQQFGKGAAHKHLTSTIFDLPTNLLDSVIQGYISADGCFTNGLWKATSVSKELIYGFGECVAKAYHTPYRIYKAKRKRESDIQGRQIEQKDTYQLVYKTEKRKQDKAFYEDGYVWCPVRSISEYGEEEVYDIEVENAHSFTVQNVIVHNCQDLSNAGKQAGMTKGSGTRSGLLWEVERILDECDELPQILLMENVPAVVGKRNEKDFGMWCDFLASKGYTNKWAKLNAADYGVPQHRERVFMVSWLGDYSYEFPVGKEIKNLLKDYLEDEVDEKFYLSDEAVKGLVRANNRPTNPL